MSNIIALIWDFDKTLVDGYMQDPIFEDYGIDGKAFWAETDTLPAKYEREQGIRVNRETIYLNQFINYAHDGRLAGLNNAVLTDYGKKQRFYPGAPQIFSITKELLQNDKRYREQDIRVEHYIVSTGFAAVIKGSAAYEYVDGVWGCEFIEAPAQDGKPVISEIAYTIDNTTKTRAIFEINKGVGRIDGINVNSSIQKDLRRVPFENMIYIGDGPSDVPAFSVVNQYGGATFAVYPTGNSKALNQVESLRMQHRINMYAEANFTEGSLACMWLCEKIRHIADGIIRKRNDIIKHGISDAPINL